MEYGYSIIEHMRNPMYNIQVPGWVQFNGVHEKSYVKYSGPRMGTV